MKLKSILIITLILIVSGFTSTKERFTEPSFLVDVCITIPDTHATDVNNVLADYWGWSSDLGLTKAQFNKQKLAEYLKGLYVSHKASLAADDARVGTDTTARKVGIQ